MTESCVVQVVAQLYQVQGLLVVLLVAVRELLGVVHFFPPLQLWWLVQQVVVRLAL
jgi:hypothetical protein